MSSYLRVLRHRDFRLLFLGQAASVVGDRVVVVALALFITQRTGSPTDLGLVLGAQTLPLVALLLFGGVWADRLPRHRIMIATDLTRAALHALLAVLILDRRRADLAARRDRGAVRRRAGVLPARLQRSAPADRSRVADPGRPRADRVDLERRVPASGRRWPPRSSSASARARRSRSTRRRSSSARCCSPASDRARAGTPRPQRPSRARCSASCARAGARSARAPGSG